MAISHQVTDGLAEVVMDFPLPGRDAPLRVRGEVMYVAPDRGKGVRFTELAPVAELVGANA